MPVSDFSGLIARVKERAHSNDPRFTKFLHHTHTLVPVVSEEQLRQAEEQLGFALPPLVRALYLEVGNGGFGPGYGVCNLYEGADGGVIRHYDRFVTSSTPEAFGFDEDEEFEFNPSLYRENSIESYWPEKLLPIVYWGCELYTCVDCSNNDLQLWIVDEAGSGEDPENPLMLARRDETLPELLERWVNSGADVEP